MTEPAIPQDQLDRARTSVEALRDTMGPLLKELPFDAESALTFSPSLEEAQ